MSSPYDVPYGNFAKSTHGRVSYDEKTTHEFGPYLKRSEVKKNRIRNEKGLKKVKDEILFTLNKWSGIQRAIDQYFIENDLHKNSNLPRSWSTVYLGKDIKNKGFTTKVMCLWLLQMLTWLVPLAFYGTKYVLDTYDALLEGYEYEQKFSKFNWRRNILDRSENTQLARNTLRGTEESALGKECPLCLEDMESLQGSIVHCRGSDGQLARNATPYHTECLENWRQAQHTTLTGQENPRALHYVHLEDMPCPSCNDPLVRDSTLSKLAPDIPYRPPPTFSRYVANKMVLDPLSKMGNSLSKAVDELSRPLSRMTNSLRGYQPVPMGEVEMQGLHLD